MASPVLGNVFDVSEALCAFPVQLQMTTQLLSPRSPYTAATGNQLLLRHIADQQQIV